MPANAVTITPDGWFTDVDLGDPDLRRTSAPADRVRGGAPDPVGHRPADVGSRLARRLILNQWMS